MGLRVVLVSVVTDGVGLGTSISLAYSEDIFHPYSFTVVVQMVGFARKETTV